MTLEAHNKVSLYHSVFTSGWLIAWRLCLGWVTTPLQNPGQKGQGLPVTAFEGEVNNQHINPERALRSATNIGNILGETCLCKPSKN